MKIFNGVYKYFFTLLTVVVGFSFLYFKLTSPRLKTNVDFYPIDGKIIHYSFKEVPGHRATLHQYYFWLDKYKCTFQIKADFLSHFDQSRFENEIRKGDILQITIPKEHNYKLQNKNETIFVLSITKKNTNYLSLNETIPKENDNSEVYFGLLFLIAGFIYYIMKHNHIVK
jgi:hypothetical protein